MAMQYFSRLHLDIYVFELVIKVKQNKEAYYFRLFFIFL